MPVRVLWSRKAYSSALGSYRASSGVLGGIVYEGRTPFPSCDTLAQVLLLGHIDAYMKPPKGLYFEADTDWAICLWSD